MKPFYLFVLFSQPTDYQYNFLEKPEHEPTIQEVNIDSTGRYYIDFRTAVIMMYENNDAIKAAEKSTELAIRESQMINASWFPTISMTGTYTMMSNNVVVSQEYAPLLDPLKEKFANSLLIPDVLNYITNQLGDLSFDVPIMEDNFGSVDLELVYPIFTGAKRIYANKLAQSNETLSVINKEHVSAAKYLELATIYFSLCLTESMIKVLEENYDMTKSHYSQAVKMENIGIFDKAERLIAKVALDECDRSLKEAQNQAEVLKNALSGIINQHEIETNKSYDKTSPDIVLRTKDISPSSPLFFNDKYPSLEWFKDMMLKNAYIYKQSHLHDEISKTNLRLSRSNYFPVVSIFGKQSIVTYQLPGNLIPSAIGGINFIWDIFDGMARERNIQKVKIESDIISSTQQDLKNELNTAVDEWYANLKQACINAKDLKSSVQLAEEIYKIRKKSFTEGLVTSQQVLDALNLINKTKLLLLTTYYEYDIALANLCCLCGIPEYFESFIDVEHDF